MLDWRSIVENPDSFKRGLVSRGFKSEISESVCEKVLSLSKLRIEAQKQANDLKAQRNIISQKVGSLMKEGKKDEAEKIKAEAKAIGDKISELDKSVDQSEDDFRKELEVIPNIPHESVPVGKTAADNKVVREWGVKKAFNFKPKAHDEIGEKLGGLDFDRAAKVSGARFTFLRGGLAQLERALASFMLDLHRPKGYVEIVAPYIVNEKTMYGIGQFPKFKEDVFKIENDDKYLIPTAEVPVTRFFADEILKEEELPYKFMSFSPCFRSEAGSYGKDVKGLIRQHQFHKVELVKFCEPEKSQDELEGMLKDAEAVLQALEIPYRTLLLCTGDMGANSQKTYDIEVWLPGSIFESDSQGCYREISSCSDCGSYQARRSHIRYKSKSFNGTRFVHTLNGSGLAVGRTLIAVMENYQNEDGSIAVPKVLRPYMAGLEVIR
ncbi:MAG: serine--tRNA ligase [Proteobacteria bacterium]|nr:serine--tRNA ligase [Pseudomonadota bacterium]